MKIAIIASVSESLLNFRAPLIQELVNLGHDVLAFAPDHDDRSRSRLSALNVQSIDFSLERAGLNPLRDIATTVELRRLLTQHKPEVVLSYFLKPVIYGTIAAWISGVPRRFALIEGLGFAFTSSGVDSLRRASARLIVSGLLKLSLGLASKVIVLNPDDASDLVGQRIVRNDRIEILGGIGVDLGEWPECPFTDKSITFTLVARMLWDKGIGEFVGAAQIVKKSRPEGSFVLVGGVDDNPAAIPRSIIEGWVAEGAIDTWAGHTNVQPWLERSSVFVLPSYREGVPRSTQEALATGRPIVTTDAPGCRETVVEGLNGFLVPPGDQDALAKAMIWFIDNPEKILPMGRESRRIAEEKFNVTKQNRALIRLMGIESAAL